MVRDFDSQRSNFEADLKSMPEEMEKGMRERERSFEEQKETELEDINYFKRNCTEGNGRNTIPK